MSEMVMENKPVEAIKVQVFDRLSMYETTPGVPGARARLSWGIRAGNPRLTVFTNDPSDTVAKGMIQAAMDPITFYGFLTKFEEIIRGAADNKVCIDCFNTKYENDQPTNDRVLTCKLCFGKDKDGVVWIALLSEGRPEIRFNFKIPDWHMFRTGDGTTLSEAGASVIAAGACHKLASQIYGYMLGLVFDNPPPKPQRLQNARVANRNFGSKPTYTPKKEVTSIGTGEPDNFKEDDDLPF